MTWTRSILRAARVEGLVSLTASAELADRRGQADLAAGLRSLISAAWPTTGAPAPRTAQ